jgi:uncharacterized protein (TIGR02246 family)
VNRTVATHAITELVDTLADAWNRADSAAFGDLFSDDVDFVEIRGGHHVGRAAIAAAHQALWDSVYAGSTVEYRVEAVRPLGGRYAVGLIGATMRAPVGPLAGTNHARFTVVVRHDGEGSEIVSFHNTLVQAQPSAA